VAEREDTGAVIRGLLHSQPLAVLATQAQGQPYANLMAFAATDDLRQVVFATRRDTHKFANLLADSRVALLVDNRANRPEDFQEAAALTVLGRARELIGRERQPYLELYLAKHPYLQDFVAQPACALLLVTVERCVLVTRFQEVRQLYPPL
jgi:nitroimidazol reductase NimA-like FMN-containing flavoprotein (pyridoxamine 5'-phosphate oxidase superfamily)